MPSQRKPEALASEAWMLEQQKRAELEAQAWRQLREQRAPAPPEPASEPQRASFNPHRAGSAALKALVRFGLAAGAAYVAVLAGQDSQMGEFEVWLAAGASFLATLSLSMLGFARALVHGLAELLRWGLVAAAAVGVFWLAATALGAGP